MYKMKKRVALIGLGPHAKRLHYPYLERLLATDNDVSFDLLVDLEASREKIEQFIEKRAIAPRELLFLPTDGQIDPQAVDSSVTEALKRLGINRVIIATEPKAHKAYLMECIRLGIPVVTDKPITSPTGLVTSFNAASRVYKDVAQLIELTRVSKGARVLVQSQRRDHRGYRYVFDMIRELTTQFNIPITSIAIQYSDGMWNMPNEYFTRENHPYKYGYGELMHSGYHFVDLLARLLAVNDALSDKAPDELTLFSQISRARDQRSVIRDSDYATLFTQQAAEQYKAFDPVAMTGFGEVDSYSQLQLLRDGNVMTTAQLALIQSGISQRAWTELPEDTYMGNGRLRHEHVSVHIGPLANIQVHSYQSQESSEQPAGAHDIGDINHFDVYVFRNSNLIGGKAFEKIRFGAQDAATDEDAAHHGHNERARHQVLDELMYDLPSGSEIMSHDWTNRLLSEMYKNHVRQYQGLVPYSVMSLMPTEPPQKRSS